MTHKTGADIVIIGGGVEGLAIAWALGAMGVRDVVVLERNTVGSGFTAFSSGIIRCHYGVPSIARMAWRSLEVLENAVDVLGVDIGYHRCGYVVGVGADNRRQLAANVLTQQALGIDVQMIGHDQVNDLYPLLRTDDCDAFAYEPRGAYADAYQTAQGLAGRARDRGARIRQNSPVAEILTNADAVDGVRLVSGECVGTDVVIVAAGPWTSDLVKPLGIDVPVKAMREQILIVDPGIEIGMVPVLSDLVDLQYVRKEAQNHLLVGNSDHSRPAYTDPDRFAGAVDDDFLSEAVVKFQHRFPSFDDASLVSSYAACYDVTPDFNPVIGPTSVDGLYVCAGFSGHGFKIAPEVGRLTADIVVNGRSREPTTAAEDFRLTRFDEDDLLVSPNPYVGAPEMR